MLEMGGLVALSALVAALIVLRRPPPPEQTGPAPGDEAAALVDQAQAAMDSERFEEAARLSQSAIDKDPLAQGPRKLLATARREQQNQKAISDAMWKAQVC